jgi:SAM-dependent methyltransferase
LLHLSFLGREGIKNSGSYHFADHIYQSVPKGYWGIGKLVDRIVLALPSCRSFRNRYLHSKNEIVNHVLSSKEERVHILSVPSGLPRDLLEAADFLRENHPDSYKKVVFYCLDADPNVLREAKELVQRLHLQKFVFLQGDALNGQVYPPNIDLITSSGFTEFIDDETTGQFYAVCHQQLKKGGRFVTSSTVRHKLSEYLMRNIAELLTNYREEDQLEKVFQTTPFRDVKLVRDPFGYQVLVKAEKVVHS